MPGKRPGKKTKPKWTPKQKRFYEAYISKANGNATEAARLARYKGNDATLAQVGAQNLRKPHIAEAIAEFEKRLEEKAEKSALDIIHELERVGFSNMADFVEFGGKKGLKIKDISELGEDAKRCVAEVSITKSKDGGSLRFKLHDKVRSLELLGRRFGIFKNPAEVEGLDKLSDIANRLGDLAKQAERFGKDVGGS